MIRAAGALAMIALAGLASAAHAEGSRLQGATVVAVPASPDRARPAESGAHDTAATVGPLAIGAEVRDATGALIGHVVLLTTDKRGQSVAKVREDEDVYLIPTADLRATGHGAISTITLAALRHGGGAIAASRAR